MRALEDEVPQFPCIIPLPLLPHPSFIIRFSNLFPNVLTLLDLAIHRSSIDRCKRRCRSNRAQATSRALPQRRRFLPLRSVGVKWSNDVEILRRGSRSCLLSGRLRRRLAHARGAMQAWQREFGRLLATLATHTKKLTSTTIQSSDQEKNRTYFGTGFRPFPSEPANVPPKILNRSPALASTLFFILCRPLPMLMESRKLFRSLSPFSLVSEVWVVGEGSGDSRDAFDGLVEMVESCERPKSLRRADTALVVCTSPYVIVSGQHYVERKKITHIAHVPSVLVVLNGRRFHETCFGGRVFQSAITRGGLKSVISRLLQKVR